MNHFIVRLVLLPLVVFWVLSLSIGIVIVWLLDPTYDHDAAIMAYEQKTAWLRR